MILPALATPIGLAPSVAIRAPGSESAGDFGGTLASLVAGTPVADQTVAPTLDLTGRQPGADSGKSLPDVAMADSQVPFWSPGGTITPLLATPKAVGTPVSIAPTTPPDVTATIIANETALPAPPSSAPVLPSAVRPAVAQVTRAEPALPKTESVLAPPASVTPSPVGDPRPASAAAPSVTIPLATPPLRTAPSAPALVTATALAPAAMATSALTPVKSSVVAALIDAPPEEGAAVPTKPDPATSRPQILPDRTVRIGVRGGDRPAAGRPAVDADDSTEAAPDPDTAAAEREAPIPVPGLPIAQPAPTAVVVPVVQPSGARPDAPIVAAEDAGPGVTARSSVPSAASPRAAAVSDSALPPARSGSRRQETASPVPPGAAPALATPAAAPVVTAATTATPTTSETVPAAAPIMRPLPIAGQAVQPASTAYTPALGTPVTVPPPVAETALASTPTVESFVRAETQPLQPRSQPTGMTPPPRTASFQPPAPLSPSMRAIPLQAPGPVSPPAPALAGVASGLAPAAVAPAAIAPAGAARVIPGAEVPALAPIVTAAAPAPASADSLPPRWSLQDTALPLTLVAQQPASPAIQPQPGTVASAAQVFGAAIQAAQGRDEPRSQDDATLLAPLAATGPVHALAQTADAQAPLDMRQERWPAAMIERIDMLRDAVNATDTRIRLIPDALGAIDVAVRQDGDTVHVHFTAEQAATRTLLQEAQPRLAELADARGLKLSQGSVDTGAGQQQRAATPQQPQAPSRPRAAAATAADTDSTDTRLA